MREFNFKGILQSEGWYENMTVSVNEKGNIQKIEKAANIEKCSGYAIPGFQNAHSHAFQYAMAGLAELHDTTTKKNDFWSWRQSMYELALKVRPEQVEAIAAMLYKEMLRHGYTHVAEFHYIHNDLKGNSYSNRAELSERIARAAQSVGIGLTIIPIYYEQGGFGIPAQKEQRRFLSASFEDYLELYESVMKMSKNYEHCNVGMGIHSMRGVSLENIIKLADYRQGNTPFHIHIAEQLKEIKDCISFTGMRPTEWFIKNIELNKNFHLVHATHLSETETSQLARLTSHSRNTFGNSSSGDNGAIAIKSALVNGRRAMGMENETYFKVGTPLDAVVISDGHPLIGMTGMKHLTNTIVYASDANMIQGTIAGGSWKIRTGENQDTQIEQNFIKTMKDLSNRL